MLFHLLFSIRVRVELGNIVFDSLQTAEEEARIALLFYQFSYLFDLFKQVLKKVPYFLEVFVIECAVDLDCDLFDDVPFFSLFCEYYSFLIVSLIIVHKVLDYGSGTY